MSTRFLGRRRFKSIEFNVNLHFDVQDRIKKVLERFNYTEFQCYMIFDQPSGVAYDYYTAGEEGEKPPILIIDKSGNATEVSKLSEPIKALAGRPKIRFNLYVPEECALEVESIIRAGR